MVKRQEDMFAEEARDKALDRATAHANRVQADWDQMAMQALMRYMGAYSNAGLTAQDFTAEDVREWAVWVPEPPDRRAWGGVFMKAARAGRIRQVGYRKHRDPSRHRGISTVWKAGV